MEATVLSATTPETSCGTGEKQWTYLVGTCIAFSYVVSLYVHPRGRRLIAFPTGNRNDPVEILSRFYRVFYASLFSFALSAGFQIAYGFGNRDLRTGNEKVWKLLKILEKMGFRGEGFFNAAIIPVFLTLILFLGPIAADFVLGRFQGYNQAFISLLYHNLHFRRKILRNSLFSLIWWRAFVVAPFSEEFVYRACLVPVITPCFGAVASILVSPLSFGVAHLHHIFDRIRQGASWKEAILSTLFQIFYTALFGAYSAYLFVRTGHFIAPVLVHALCNALGVPDVGVVKSPKRAVVAVLYFVGLFAWTALLKPLTNPELYGNL